MAFLGQLKFKWFKRRLVFNDPQHSGDAADAEADDSDFDGPRSRRDYRPQASAEPQLVRAVFRTGREYDDWVDEWTTTTTTPKATEQRQLPPIRVRTNERAHGNGRLLYARPNSTLFAEQSVESTVEQRRDDSENASTLKLVDKHDDDGVACRLVTNHSDTADDELSFEEHNPSIFSRPQSLQCATNGIDVAGPQIVVPSSPTVTNDNEEFEISFDKSQPEQMHDNYLSHRFDVEASTSHLSSQRELDQTEDHVFKTVEFPPTMRNIVIDEESSDVSHEVDFNERISIKPSESKDVSIESDAALEFVEPAVATTLIAESQPHHSLYISTSDLTPFAGGSAEVEVSPSQKEPLIFASVEDLSSVNASAGAPPTRPIPPPRRASMNRKARLPVLPSEDPPPYAFEDPIAAKQPAMQMSASTPNLHVELQRTDDLPAVAVASSVASLLPTHPPVSRTRSIFSFFTNANKVTEPEPKVAKKKMKTVRVLKTAKPSAQSLAREPVPLPRKLAPQPPQPQVATEAPIVQPIVLAVPEIRIEQTVPQFDPELKTHQAETSFIEADPEEGPTNTEETDVDSEDVTDNVPPLPMVPVGPPIIHLHEDEEVKKLRSPNANKSVRFVMPEVSEDEGDKNDDATSRPAPMRRTVLTLDKPANDDPWAMVDQHRRATEALDRNRQLAALASRRSSPSRAEPKRCEGTQKAESENADDEVLTLQPRPRTLREMQREQRERRERQQQAEMSDTEA